MIGVRFVGWEGHEVSPKLMCLIEGEISRIVFQMKSCHSPEKVMYVDG